MASPDETRLLRDLLQAIDPYARPTQNYDEPVDVQLNVMLKNIMNVVS